MTEQERKEEETGRSSEQRKLHSIARKALPSLHGITWRNELFGALVPCHCLAAALPLARQIPGHREEQHAMRLNNSNKSVSASGPSTAGRPSSSLPSHGLTRKLLSQVAHQYGAVTPEADAHSQTSSSCSAAAQPSALREQARDRIRDQGFGLGIRD